MHQEEEEVSTSQNLLKITSVRRSHMAPRLCVEAMCVETKFGYCMIATINQDIKEVHWGRKQPLHRPFQPFFPNSLFNGLFTTRTTPLTITRTTPLTISIGTTPLTIMIGTTPLAIMIGTTPPHHYDWDHAPSPLWLGPRPLTIMIGTRPPSPLWLGPCPLTIMIGTTPPRHYDWDHAPSPLWLGPDPPRHYDWDHAPSPLWLGPHPLTIMIGTMPPRHYDWDHAPSPLWLGPCPSLLSSLSRQWNFDYWTHSQKMPVSFCSIISWDLVMNMTKTLPDMQGTNRIGWKTPSQCMTLISTYWNLKGHKLFYSRKLASLLVYILLPQTVSG